MLVYVRVSVCERPMISLFVRVHESECVSKVPHSFIMSSECEEQNSRQKEKQAGRKETTEAGSLLWSSYN